MKVLHLPTSIGGNAWALAQAEKKTGIDSTVLVSENNWIDYPCDINLGIEKMSKVGKLIKSLETFLRYRNRFDVFHFNFGKTLIDPSHFPLLELPFYPKGKKIIFTFNGCDARQKFKTVPRVPFSACHDEVCYQGMCNSGKLDKIREEKIKKIRRYAHHIFALNPDLMWFLPEGLTSFLPYAVNGDIAPVKYGIDKKITVVHAPTNRAAKGSAYILAALDELKKKYSNLEIKLVENIPHKEALEIYKNAHLVIDQVLIGWYGGFAVEVMKMGKPVAVFIRQEDLKFVPLGMAKDLKDAFIDINPFNIVEVLSNYLENVNLLHDKSRASLEYANKWHDPIYLASITKSIYER